MTDTPTVTQADGKMNQARQAAARMDYREAYLFAEEAARMNRLTRPATAPDGVVEALTVLAKRASGYEGDYDFSDDHVLLEGFGTSMPPLTVGHCRSARAALAKPTEPAADSAPDGVVEVAGKAVVAEYRKIWPGAGWPAKPEGERLARAAFSALAKPTEPEAGLVGELRGLHEAARGCEFDLVPADGPIARLALFMHEKGDRILTALRAQPTPQGELVDGDLERTARKLLAAEMTSPRQRAHIEGDGSAAYATVTGPQAIRAIVAALASLPARQSDSGEVERLGDHARTAAYGIGEVERLRSHIAEQTTHVEARIQDGKEMGASVWRIALEDVARENRAALQEGEGHD